MFIHFFLGFLLLLCWPSSKSVGVQISSIRAVKETPAKCPGDTEEGAMNSNLMLERLHGEGDELNLERCVDRTVAFS